MNSVLPLSGPGCPQLDSFSRTLSLPWSCLFSGYHSRALLFLQAFQPKGILLPSTGLGSQHALVERNRCSGEFLLGMKTPVADEHWAPYGLLALSTTDGVNW